MANITGTSGSDTYVSIPGSNTVNLGLGDDTYFLGVGADVIVDDGGQDTLVFTTSVYGDWVSGSWGGSLILNDFWNPHQFENFYGSTSNDVLIMGSSFTSTLLFRMNDGVDEVVAGGGSDYLYGGAGNDRLDGNNGDDFLSGDAGDDSLLGGFGDDSFTGGVGRDTINGSFGYDTLELDGHYGNVTGGWVVNMIAGTVRTEGRRTDNQVTIFSSETDFIQDIEQVFGSSGKDTFYADYADVGSLVVTKLHGENGIDTLITAPTITDSFTPSGRDAADAVIFTGIKQGTIENTGYVGGGDFIFPVSIKLEFSGMEIVDTGVGNDSVTGSGFSEIIRLGAGDDTATLGGGSDSANGDAGNDSLTGGFGNDTLNGGTGTDTARFNDHTGHLGIGWDINLATGVAKTPTNIIIIGSGIAYETDTFTGMEKIYASSGKDTVSGSLIGAGTQVFLGAGNDIATMGSNNDTVFGEAGIDTISGGAGLDNIMGGAGADILTGGLGADKFFYVNTADGTDVISDFAVDDFFAFKGTVFGALPAGALAATRFWSNTTGVAHDADDRFIFNTTDDTLWYDSNGSAAGGAFKMADMNIAFNLTAADVLIV
jgi:Ca2+-binding RTX toxin-like protein